MIEINIAKEFTDLPGPRYQKQGDGSGEEFREKHLKPAFLEARETNGQVLIQLDGVRYGYPTSFLEEAFGGLARVFGIKAVQDVLRFESATEPLLVDEILRYIERAEKTLGD